MDDLDRALARLERANAEQKHALNALHAVIRQRLVDSAPRGTQAEVARRTGYSRERLRQIVRTPPVDDC